MSVCPFNFGQLSPAVLRQFDRDGQLGNAAEPPSQVKMSDADHTYNSCFHYDTIYEATKGITILTCLYGRDILSIRSAVGQCEGLILDIAMQILTILNYKVIMYLN